MSLTYCLGEMLLVSNDVQRVREIHRPVSCRQVASLLARQFFAVMKCWGEQLRAGAAERFATKT